MHHSLSVLVTKASRHRIYLFKGLALVMGNKPWLP